MIKNLNLLLLFFFLMFFSEFASSDENIFKLFPEPSSTKSFENKQSSGENYVIVSANNYATNAAKNILEMGGSAADAAVTVQLILGLVEPQSSGIGGGSFALYYEKNSKKVFHYDGREIAPAKIQSDIFLNKNKTPKKFYDAVIGGHSVGVPGTLKALKRIHDDHGKLRWEQVLKPAIELSKKGFYAPPRLINALKKEKYLWKLNNESPLFKEIKNNPKKLIHNNAYTETLIKISKNYKDFYDGGLASQIVNTVKNSDINPGFLSKEDMKNYKVKKTKALCVELKKFLFCGPQLPSSGGIAIAQALKLYEKYDFKKNQTSFEKIIKILNFIYKEREDKLADDRFIFINKNKILKLNYLRNSFKLELEKKLNEKNKNTNFNSTSHFSILDSFGNVISMTSSIENSFGSRLFTGGFFLNNQLTDFSFRPIKNNKKINNRVQGKKKPLSSMSPTIILDKNKDFLFSVGSPGGTAIISYVLKTIIDVMYLNINPLDSIKSGNYVMKNDKLYLEKKLFNIEKIKDKIEIDSKLINEVSLTSGIGIILKKNGQYFGFADIRRDGTTLAK
ncbi:MAG: hypothetical protein CBE14_003490 [Rickettsiales bacterium TMED254]|nr:hypothetical protein [Rickettsiales bacterium]RPF75703.1 MAG: hypothetical protein CBE14_003490 [Rickettsiales bacterium TMED254]